MGFQLAVSSAAVLFLCCTFVHSQLNLPQYQQQRGGYSNSISSNSGYGGNSGGYGGNSGAYGGNSGGYGGNSGGYGGNSGGYGGNSGGYSSSYSAPSSGYNAGNNSPYGSGALGGFDNYKAPPRTSRTPNSGYGMEAQGSQIKVNVGFSSPPAGGSGWQRPSAGKGREAWKGSKGDSDFKFFTAIGSGIDSVKNGVKKVVKGVKSTKAKIVAKGISGVGTAVSAVTKGVAGVITKVADW